MWRNVALALVLVGAMLGTFVPGIARADDADPEAIRRAKTEFEDGSHAYRAERWELAASHFEAADEAVPDDRALRMAMRARQKAGHKARAATLAAAALRRYPNADGTVDLANELLHELRDELHEIEITCTRPCVLTVGTRVVPGRRAESWSVFLDPGAARVSAAFETGGPASHQLDAIAGGSGSITLEPTAAPAPTSTSTPTPPATPRPGEGTAVDTPAADGPSFIEHPGVFVAALVATAGLGGVTIWSGIDTLQDPGEETVREACRGEGPRCPEYQLGLEKQLRTNILIGATAGMAVLTGIIGLAVTDWGGDDDVEAAWLEGVSIAYGANAGPDGGLFTLHGRF
jgi:hypothetical protein